MVDERSMACTFFLAIQLLHRSMVEECIVFVMMMWAVPNIVYLEDIESRLSNGTLFHDTVVVGAPTQEVHIIASISPTSWRATTAQHLPQ